MQEIALNREKGHRDTTNFLPIQRLIRKLFNFSYRDWIMWITFLVSTQWSKILSKIVQISG